MQQDFEKLGVFYLGRLYDAQARELRDDLLLYDSRDLVTHAVCVGMTGSGKTGLCIALLEEAAIDGIPAIIIDPKGDLTNLMLTFPDLRPEDFEPWVNTDEARRKEQTVEEFARKQATLWREGLAQWGQSGDRIRRLRESAEVAIYTPGSTAGTPISILRSFAAPGDEVLDDPELLAERVATTATSILGLLGINADPIQSREHILISNLLHRAWEAGQALDLAGLISQIQEPPIERIGVLEMESFFPSKARFELAMRLNNLLAAPGFATWLKGEPLDIARLLYTESGKPRLAILSIAHLGDAERMFFVSLLLNQVLGWMRQQGGTTSLRALLYMDEIFGYLPPVANPPSKPPMLTLLKQARAFGLGVVLATQNPVDLDYKALANCGTWFIGRLQTERDKARLIEGLEGAAQQGGGRFDRGRMEQLLASLGSRVFLMNNVHEEAPVVFQTRWVMSYLAGPLTRTQIRKLAERDGSTASPAAETPAAPAAVPAASPSVAPAQPAPVQTRSEESHSTTKPPVPPEIEEVFIPPQNAPTGATLVYVPRVLGLATVYVHSARHGVNQKQETCLAAAFADAPGGLDWRSADELSIAESSLRRSPQPGISFAPLPSDAARPKNYGLWQRSLVEMLYRSSEIELLHSRTFDLTSHPGEPERSFRARLANAAREKRDELKDKLRKKYEPKLRRLEERRRKAELAVQREEQQASAAKVQTGVSIGATILGALFGRRKVSAGTIGRATTAARGAGRTVKEWQDVERAKEAVAAIDRELAELEQAFHRELEEAQLGIDATTEPLETIAVRPRKSDISVRLVALAWLPHVQSSAGTLSPAW